MQKLKSWFTAMKQPSISAPYSETRSASNEPQPELVQQLLQEHNEIISLFTHAIKLAESHKFEKAIHELGQFQSTLTEHLIKTNSELYLVLNAEYRHDPFEFQLISRLRQNMTSSTKTLLDFIQTWRLHGINQSNLDRFLDQSQSLLNELINRLKEEEHELFPLYQTPPELEVLG